MSRKSTPAVARGTQPTTRCAIYTRKSTEDGLEQEYNSLDAQRDAGEAYITSQKHEGWLCLPTHYDDGGFTGANMERPALRQLLADIEAGKVDCVVVYKVDRLSRSLLDFARIMETFDRYQVAFVSVTQAFNTGSSMGRLVLNVLLSFAQFEREMISERTRDKIAAARRKGKWAGGWPVLGYNVVDTKLYVNEEEAALVRAIYRLYLEKQSAIAVVQEINRRGWVTKQWTTHKGTSVGGRPFDKATLYKLLTNSVYIGKVRHKEDEFDGEHDPLLDRDLFDRVQELLRKNASGKLRPSRSRHDSLLRGLLRCAACNCAMGHTYAKRDRRLYRYYVCQRAQKRGRQSCPAPSLAAVQIERFVIEQIRGVARDPAVIRQTLAEVRHQTELGVERLAAEHTALKREIGGLFAKAGKQAAAGDAQLVETQDRIRVSESRLAEIAGELSALRTNQVDDAELIEALQQFDRLWEVLSPKERSRVLALLIDRVEYDGREGQIAISYRSAGVRTLVTELTQSQETATC